MHVTWKAVRKGSSHEVGLDTWVTEDSQEIKIVDMESGHLINTIRFLERRHLKANKYAPTWSSQEPGEFDPDFDDVVPHPMYLRLRQEAESRGLKV